MSVRLLAGDCRETLATLPAGSVQACVTSPPYFGLRDYGLPPLVWGGDAKHEHEWGTHIRPGQSGGTGKSGLQRDGRREEVRGPNQARWVEANTVPPVTTSFCACGAWQGSLGLEPTPDCGRTNVRMRANLTRAQRAYVLQRLGEEGLL